MYRRTFPNSLLPMKQLAAVFIIFRRWLRIEILVSFHSCLQKLKISAFAKVPHRTCGKKLAKTHKILNCFASILLVRRIPYSDIDETQALLYKKRSLIISSQNFGNGCINSQQKVLDMANL